MTWNAVVLAVSAGVFPPVSAASAKPAKKATAILKKESKAFVKSFKKDLEFQRGILSANLAPIDAKLKAGNGTLNDVTALFSTVVDYQKAVASLWNLNIFSAGDVLMSAVSVLDAAGLAAADYTKDFQYGRGGAVDDFFRDIQKALDGSTKKALARIQKTVKLFEKKAGIGVICRIESPRTVLPLYFGPGPDWGSLLPNPPSVDTLITASDLSVTGDGRLYASGSSAGNPAIAIALLVGNPQSPTQTGNRWELKLFGQDEGANQLVAYPSTVDFANGTGRAFWIR